MKKFVQLFAALAFMIFAFQSNTVAQQFNTGSIGIAFDNYGKISVHYPSVDTTVQIARLSPLFGTNGNVMDYKNDPDNVVAPTAVTPATFGDYELNMTIDNGYSGAAPDAVGEMYGYGVDGGAFAIIRITVSSNEPSGDYYLGYEVVTELDGSYGDEIVKYIDSLEIMSYTRSGSGNTVVGIKMLAPALGSAHHELYVSGYHEAGDSVFWNPMTSGIIDTLFNGDASSGVLSFLSTDAINIEQDGNTTYYLGVSVGENKSQMISSMNECDSVYNLLRDYLAPEFENGMLAIDLNTYGDIDIFAPNFDSVRQVDRLSPLVGAEGSVHDYWNDLMTVKEPTKVLNTTVSDYQLSMSLNNGYTGNAPDFLGEINVYGWDSVGYAIVEMDVTNLEASAKDFYLGYEFLPKLDDLYGFEEVAHLSNDDVVKLFRSNGTKVMGFKILSHPMGSFNAFEWFTDYSFEADTIFWNPMSSGNVISSYASGSNGLVGIFNTNAVNIGNNQSTKYYVGFAVGADEADMLSNMGACETKYNETFVISVDDKDAANPERYALSQNYPNPFNPSTTIDFALPEAGFVSLKVYNILGQEIATLVKENLESGYHQINFNASDLPSGVYIYKIESGSFVSSKKMILMK